jgi:hypothetical protein
VTIAEHDANMLEAKLGASFRARVLFVGIMTCGLGALLLHWVSRGYVRTLSVEGITLRNGRTFAWKDLESLRAVYTRRRHLNHVTLVFKSGAVGLFYQVFDNGDAVLDFVRQVTGNPLPVRRPL